MFKSFLSFLLLAAIFLPLGVILNPAMLLLGVPSLVICIACGVGLCNLSIRRRCILGLLPDIQCMKLAISVAQIREAAKEPISVMRLGTVGSVLLDSRQNMAHKQVAELAERRYQMAKEALPRFRATRDHILEEYARCKAHVQKTKRNRRADRKLCEAIAYMATVKELEGYLAESGEADG